MYGKTDQSTPINYKPNIKFPDFSNAQPEDNRSIRTHIKKYAKGVFEGASKSHDWEHTERVIRLSQHIGQTEKADMVVLEVAAYLHDIGRNAQDKSNGKICHAEQGAQIAESIVKQLPLSEQQQQNIVHCVRSHRFRDEQQPSTIEAKVLFDADKLDAIGAVGVARAYLFAGELGAMLHNTNNDISQTQSYSQEDTGYREYKVKLCKIKDRMLTATGRQMATDRHQFMELFFDRFVAEVAGNL